MRTYGLDLSNYTTNVPVPNSGTGGGLITDELVASWMAAGFTHAIIGTQWPEVAKHQLEVCHRGGMSLDLYSWLDWQGDITEYLRTRLPLAAGYPIGIHWLDAEQSRGSLSPATIDDEIRLAVAYVVAAGQKPGIYTAAWWWPDNTGRSTEFKDLPLWHAAYAYGEGKAPAQADAPEMATFVRYGGWTAPTMWQYAGSVKDLGANLDMNVMDYDPRQGQEDSDMMKRFNTVSPRMAGAAVTERDNVGLDWFADPVPAGAKMLRLEAYLNSGALRVFDGSGGYAGQVGWGGADADPGIIDVNVEAGFFSLEGPASLAQLGVVGYWS
jgi:hypothetical protein